MTLVGLEFFLVLLVPTLAEFGSIIVGDKTELFLHLLKIIWAATVSIIRLWKLIVSFTNTMWLIVLFIFIRLLTPEYRLLASAFVINYTFLLLYYFFSCGFISCFIFHSSDYRVNTSDPVGKMLGIYPAGPAMSTAMVLLTTALVLKLFMTVFTFGIKVPTGLFIPSLAVSCSHPSYWSSNDWGPR